MKEYRFCMLFFLIFFSSSVCSETRIQVSISKKDKNRTSALMGLFNFFKGGIIGLGHGTCNNAGYNHMLTYFGSHMLDALGSHSNASLWGHAIGQTMAETKPEDTFPRWNFTWLVAILGS